MDRVWDAFLSPRDREHVDLTWRKQAPFGFGSRPAVLVIDDYLASLGDRPLPLLDAVAEWPNSCGLEGWEAVDRTQTLLQAARARDVKIVFTTNDAQGPPWSLEAAGRPSTPEHLHEHRYDIVDALKPEIGDTVLEKIHASAFFETGLIARLVLWQVDTVLICGNSTSGCVRATAVDASAYRLRVGVVEECTFDRTEASHAMSLFDLEHKYADVHLARRRDWIPRVRHRAPGPVVESGTRYLDVQQRRELLHTVEVGLVGPTGRGAPRDGGLDRQHLVALVDLHVTRVDAVQRREQVGADDAGAANEVVALHDRRTRCRT